MICDIYYDVILYIVASMRIAITPKILNLDMSTTHNTNRFLLKAITFRGVKYV